MTDHPIIFSAPMVRALLADRKTMTRRLAWHGNPYGLGSLAKPTAWQKVKPGDRLWVRENIWQAAPYPGALPSGDADDSGRWSSRLVCYAADGNPSNVPNKHYPQAFRDGSGHFSAPDPYACWLQRPSIHMPRWASRLTLIVEAVKVERLQDISMDDAVAEGLWYCEEGDAAGFWFAGPDYKPDDVFGDGSVECYQRLWESLHGKDAWDANPEVVALTFRVVRENIDRVKEP